MKPAKKILLAALVFAVMFALSSCGGNKAAPVAKGDAATAGEAVSSVTAGEEPGSAAVPYDTITAAPVSSGEYRAAYKDFLTNYISGRSSADKDRGHFELIYVDNDDIPELAVSPRDNKGAKAELYVYRGEAVQKAGEYGSDGMLLYLPRKGIIVSSYETSGEHEKTVYRLVNGEVKEVGSYRVRLFDVASSPEDFFYYINGKQVSHKEYQDAYSKDVPSEPVSAPATRSADGEAFALSAEGLQKCFDPDSGGAEKTARQSAGDPYAPVVKNYAKQRMESAAVAGYELKAPEYDYAVKDINSDGVAELVIREKTGDGTGGVIGAIYTMRGNTPLELYFIGRHGNYTVSSDGYFIWLYHEARIEKLVGTELVTVAESPRLNWSEGKSEPDGYSDFLKTNGVSLEEMAFDYVPFNN